MENNAICKTYGCVFSFLMLFCHGINKFANSIGWQKNKEKPRIQEAMSKDVHLTFKRICPDTFQLIVQFDIDTFDMTENYLFT